MSITTTTEANIGTPGHDPFPEGIMSQTPETDCVIEKIAAMSLPDQIAQLSAHGRVLERQRQSLARQLADEKEDNADTQKKWNEALDGGMKVLNQRDTLRLQLAKHGIEPAA